MKAHKILFAGLAYIGIALLLATLTGAAIAFLIHPVVGVVVAALILFKAFGGFGKTQSAGMAFEGLGKDFDWSTFWAVLIAVFVIWILHGLFHPILLRMGRAMHDLDADGDAWRRRRRREEEEEEEEEGE